MRQLLFRFGLSMIWTLVSCLIMLILMNLAGKAVALNQAGEASSLTLLASLSFILLVASGLSFVFDLDKFLSSQ